MVSYGVNYDGTLVGTGKQTAEGMEEPLYQWTPVIGASGMLFYTGSAFPEWKEAFSTVAVQPKTSCGWSWTEIASSMRSGCSAISTSGSGGHPGK